MSKKEREHCVSTYGSAECILTGQMSVMPVRPSNLVCSRKSASVRMTRSEPDATAPEQVMTCGYMRTTKSSKMRAYTLERG